MLYTPLTKKALKLSFAAHKDQLDKSGMPYVYHPFHVAKLKDNPIARAVKLADLRHNSDLSRLDAVDEKALERVEKYKKAIALLTLE